MSHTNGNTGAGATARPGRDRRMGTGLLVAGGAVSMALLVTGARAPLAAPYALAEEKGVTACGEDVLAPEASDGPMVCGITCVGTSGMGRPLADNGPFGMRIALELSRETEVDWESSHMVLVPSDKGDESIEVGATPWDGEPQDGPVRIVGFEAPEGSYSEVEFVVVAADSGTVRSDTYRDVRFDGAPPVGRVLMGGREPGEGSLLSDSGVLALEVEAQDLVMDDDGNPMVDALATDESLGRDLPIGPWQRDQDADVWRAQVGTDPLPDGSYFVRMECEDQAGNAMRPIGRHFAIDTKAPMVDVEVPFGELRVEGDAAYSNRDLGVVVSMADVHLDKEASTVLGVPVRELETSDGDYECDGMSFSCESLPVESPTEGMVGARFAIVLHEGSFDMTRLACAVDEAGHGSGPSVTADEVPIGRLVVDKTAPRIHAVITEEPSDTVATQSAGIASFFGRPTTLVLEIEDEGGVRGVSIDARSLAEGRVPRVSDDLASVSIPLGESPLTSDSVVCVEDRAGNAVWWSLGAEGLVRTSRGTVGCANEPLRDPRGRIVADGHPARLIEDVTAPEVRMEGVEGGAFKSTDVSLVTHVMDCYLGYVATCDPARPLIRVHKDGKFLKTVSVGYPDASLGDQTHDYGLTVPARKSHEDDGVYTVEAELRDLAGNVSGRVERTFVIDTTPPELSVAFDVQDDGAQAAVRSEEGTPYFRSQRTAHVRLRDEGMSVDDLNAVHPTIRVVPHARLGRVDSDVRVSPWRECEKAGTFACEVTFPVDGTYELEVMGVDNAGNPLCGTGGTVVSEEGKYVSGPFVIDATEPRVTFSCSSVGSEPGQYDDMAFYGKPVTMRVQVVDRSLDVRNTTVALSDGSMAAPAWEASQPDERGEVTYVASVLYVEEETGRGAGRKEPKVHMADLAGNESDGKAQPFVVDQTAPTVDEVSVSKDPSASGVDPSTQDPFWFYDERDGVAAAVRLRFSDEYLLAAAWVSDPDGAYEVRETPVRGRTSSMVELRLKDFEAQGGQYDTDWDRTVTLHVRDMAGNVREWSLDRTGKVVADRATSDANLALNGLGLFPLALVSDATAPEVAVSGVEGGTYYREPQVAHLMVREHNFGYVERFDPQRVVATIDCIAGNEGRAHTSWTIPAAALKGTSPYYGADQPFSADGHYRIEARLEDMSGNESEVVSVGEFTVDTTRPLIQVVWDNNEARNGSFYNAPRTATVMVTEHNFDPALFFVKTTGVLGGWESEGDRHWCKVAFLEDASPEAPHTLSVAGADRAGNEATTYEEPPFAIDTKAPTVELRRRTSGEGRYELTDDEAELLDGSAFARGIMPMVVCEDEANLDVTGIEVSIEGRRGIEEGTVGLLEHRTTEGDDRVTLDWGNIGLSENSSGPFYALDADDIYTITAQVRDLAGNLSQRRSATFSVNRYGSNFLVEPLYAQAVGGEGVETLLVEPPRIVVHEINVSGAMPPDAGSLSLDDHNVTKEYANATTSLVRTGSSDSVGYALAASTDASATNPYEGWAEYVYTIHEGNFGKGSSSDYGDGGQGLYRVDVSTHDRADNHNTTARFWGSGASRAEEAKDRSATVSFMLDEFGPQIEDVDLPGPLELGDSYDASFRLRDEITNGDYVEVLVDGSPVPVYPEGATRPLGADGMVSKQGTYHFEIPAKPIVVPRSVEIRARDYTRMEDRARSVSRRGFRLTTLRAELLALGALSVVVGVVVAVVYRIRLVA